MFFRSFVKEVDLLNRYAQSLPDGMIKIDIPEDNFEKIFLTITPSYGLYDSKPFLFKVVYRSDVFDEIRIINENRIPHPNLAYRLIYKGKTLPYASLTLASHVEFIVHLLHFPDFGDPCVSGNFETDEYISAYIQDELPDLDPEYPYHTSSQLRSLYSPSFDLIMPGIANLDVSYFNSVKYYQKSEDLVLLSAKPTVINISRDGEIINTYLHFERGSVRHFISAHLSNVTQDTFQWSSSDNNEKPHFQSNPVSGTQYMDPWYFEDQSNVIYEKHKKRDLFGCEIINLQKPAKKFELLIPAVKWELETMHLRMKSCQSDSQIMNNTRWPIFFAPGRCLPMRLLEMMQYSALVSDFKRASCISLLLDFMKATRNVKAASASVFLIDPMALSSNDALICALCITKERECIGKRWFSGKDFVKGFSTLIADLGPLRFINLTSLAFLTIFQNYIFLFYRHEVYTQLGMSRPPEDTSLHPRSVHHSSHSYTRIPVPSNSGPIFDGYPFFFLYKFLDYFTYLFQFKLPRSKSGDEIVVIRPFSDLCEL